MADKEKAKAQLHQLLPVESNLQTIAKNAALEAASTFSKKERFTGTVKRLKMFDEARREEEISEVQAITTTVDDKLFYVEEQVARYYDAYVQKERTNQDAKADLIVDGVTLAEGVPATALLGFESKLKELRAMYDAIPTLPPGVKWVEDKERKGVWINPDDDIRMKTEKTVLFKEVSKATDKFPAQVEKWSSDVPVGKYIQTTEVSMLSVAKKSEILGRVDKLIQAVMDARMRANSTEVVIVELGKKMVEFIHPRG